MTKNPIQKKLSEQDKLKISQQILDLLAKSSKGLIAKEIGQKISLTDTRLVRELTRSALKEAEKRKLKTSKERIEGKATKVYNIIAQAKTSSAPVKLPQKKS